MSKWSGSTYEGEVKNAWQDGFGQHKFANGVIYEGSFMKGEFHGNGTLIYPNGVSLAVTVRAAMSPSGSGARCSTASTTSTTS